MESTRLDIVPNTNKKQLKMADNLKILKDNLDQAINPNAGVGEIFAQDHNDVVTEFINKSGKYTGASFISQKEAKNGEIPTGVLVWNNNAMNNTDTFVITVSKKTLDLNNIDRILDILSENSIIHFKDFVGRSTHLLYVRHDIDQDVNENDVYNITVRGFSENTNYTYQTDEKEQCVLSFYNKSGSGSGNGEDGKSAYELYADTTTDNPVLTLSEWLDSLNGDDGQGVPVGGTTGQVLKKRSSDDYDAAWEDEATSIGGDVDSVNGINPTNGNVDLITDNIPDSTGFRYTTTSDIQRLSDTTGTNTGDENTASIQAKRPLKTINGENLEGSGNLLITGASSPEDTPYDATTWNDNLNSTSKNSLRDKFELIASQINGAVSGFQGLLDIADTPTIDGYYIAAESGTYINAGNLVINLDDGLTIIYKSGTNYDFSVTPLDDITKIEQTIINAQEGINLNIFDETLVVNNGYWSQGPQELVANSGSGTFQFPVIEGERYFIKMPTSVIKSYAFLDINEDVIEVHNGAITVQVVIPTNCHFFSITSRWANNVYSPVTIVKSHYDITDKVYSNYTSGLSGEFDEWRKFREEFKNDLKGRSHAPDPYFNSVDLNSQIVPTVNWSSTNINPIAILNNGSFNISKANDVNIYGSGLRYSPISSYGSTRKEVGFMINKDYLLSKGFNDGDEIRFGFWVKADQSIEQMLRITNTFDDDSNGTTHLMTNTIVNDDWTWIEFTPFTFDSLSNVYAKLKIYGINSGTQLDSFVLTGLTLINSTIDIWLGYEENYETILQDEVTKALSGGITPEIEAVLETNPSFQDLMNSQHYGAYVSNFREQLRTMIDYWGKPPSEVKIVFLADSILFGPTGAAQYIANWLFSEFGIPVENTNLNSCWGGYTSKDYLRTVESSVIYPNADLVVISEAGGQNGLEQMIKLIQANSSADIVIGTWSKYTDDPAFETEGQYNQMRDMAHKYNCELWDINALLVRAIADGVYAPLYNGVLHLSSNGRDLIFEDFKKHIVSDRFYNEYNSSSVVKNEIIHLSPDFNIPLSGINYSGSWEGESHNGLLESSSNGDFIEIPFEGVGIELLFGSTNASHVVLLNGQSPSNYVDGGRYLEYATQLIGKTQADQNWQFHRLFKAIVSQPFLTNNENELEFELTIDSIVRDGSNNITSLGYTLKVDDGGLTTLGTGNINTDSSFTLRGTGEITIPTKVLGMDNWFENSTGDPNEPVSGALFNVGDTIQFFVRKTWKDNFVATDEMLSIKGLSRGSHTLRITKSDTNRTEIKYAQIFK